MIEHRYFFCQAETYKSPAHFSNYVNLDIVYLLYNISMLRCTTNEVDFLAILPCIPTF